MMEIIYYYRSRNEEQSIIATFGIRIPEWDMTLTEIKLIRGINGNLFVAPPSREYKGRDGKKEYKDYWYFGKETGERFKKKVLEVVNAYIKEKFGQESSP